MKEKFNEWKMRNHYLMKKEENILTQWVWKDILLKANICVWKCWKCRNYITMKVFCAHIHKQNRTFDSKLSLCEWGNWQIFVENLKWMVQCMWNKMFAVGNEYRW